MWADWPFSWCLPVPPNLESFMPLGGTRDNENGYDSSGGDVSCTSISRVGCKLDLLARDRCSSGTSVQPWLPLVTLGRGGFARPKPFSLTRFSEQERGGGLPCSWRRIAVAAPPLRTAASRCFGVTSNGLAEAGIARSAALAPQHGCPVRNAAPVHSSGLAVQPEPWWVARGLPWLPNRVNKGAFLRGSLSRCLS